MNSDAAALARLCDPSAEVSAHYLVGADGRVWALVPEVRRAWHAGAGSWAGQGDVNSRSIGIEVANDARSPFEARAMDALEDLLTGLLARHAIPPERVIAHSDMAPGRKSDPGPRFDWRRLALAGLSVWPGIGDACDARLATPGAPARRESAAGPAEGPRLAEALRAFGYDAPPGLALPAFRLRFRPGAGGPAGAADLAAARELARRFPVDRGGAGA